jgi:hypothetical protein
MYILSLRCSAVLRRSDRAMHGTGSTISIDGYEISIFVSFNPDSEETRKYQTNGWYATTSAIPIVSGCASREEAVKMAKDALLSTPELVEKHRLAMARPSRRSAGNRR